MGWMKQNSSNWLNVGKGNATLNFVSVSFGKFAASNQLYRTAKTCYTTIAFTKMKKGKSRTTLKQVSATFATPMQDKFGKIFCTQLSSVRHQPTCQKVSTFYIERRTHARWRADIMASCNHTDSNRFLSPSSKKEQSVVFPVLQTQSS